MTADAKPRVLVREPSPPVAESTCSSCSYFVASSRACRRYPERVLKGPRDWCGEHRPAPEVPR